MRVENLQRVSSTWLIDVVDTNTKNQYFDTCVSSSQVDMNPGQDIENPLNSG